MLTTTLGSLVGSGATLAVQTVTRVGAVALRVPQAVLAVAGQRVARSDHDRPYRSMATLTPDAAHVVAEQALQEAQRRDDPAVHQHPTEDLPVPGWDELTVAAIRQRLRSLQEDDVTTLLAYERDHGDREPVVTALENRLARLVTSR